MIYCNECGQKHPHHKPDCSQVGGKGATPRNTYSEPARENTTPDAVVAAVVIPALAEADSSTDSSTDDSSTSTGE